MKIGDMVKLVAKPEMDWMEGYRDKTFQVLDFPTDTGVELMMVDSRPEWVWIISRKNLYIVEKPLTSDPISAIV